MLKSLANLNRAILRRSTLASALVGTVLTVLNQGDLFFHGTFPCSLWWKVPLTYLVPFLVATYGALATRVDRRS